MEVKVYNTTMDNTLLEIIFQTFQKIHYQYKQLCVVQVTFENDFNCYMDSLWGKFYYIIQIIWIEFLNTFC